MPSVKADARSTFWARTRTGTWTAFASPSSFRKSSPSLLDSSTLHFSSLLLSVDSLLMNSSAYCTHLSRVLADLLGVAPSLHPLLATPLGLLAVTFRKERSNGVTPSSASLSLPAAASWATSGGLFFGVAWDGACVVCNCRPCCSPRSALEKPPCVEPAKVMEAAPLNASSIWSSAKTRLPSSMAVVISTSSSVPSLKSSMPSSSL